MQNWKILNWSIILRRLRSDRTEVIHGANIENKVTETSRLCLKAVIKETETECGEHGEWAEYYIPRNVGWQTFWEMSPSIPRNVSKPSRECPQTFRETLLNIPGSFAKNSGKCPQKIQRILENILGHIVKHPVENIKALRWMNTAVLDTSDYELYLFVWKPFFLSSTFKKLDYLFHWEIQDFGLCFKKEVNRERNREKKSKLMYVS